VHRPLALAKIWSRRSRKSSLAFLPISAQASLTFLRTPAQASETISLNYLFDMMVRTIQGFFNTIF
jgi:hypothetical protein